ncbi:hypothetical protein AB0E08_47465 [Streptomyces sp. NPDC048281]|uniref:hypothetical protein n=1 Tax=Streptomyces sp. NPDC048281 TaxID=3154715 RepID=UPI00342B3BF2
MTSAVISPGAGDFHVGAAVELACEDPEFVAGTRGVIEAVHADPADGFDVRLGDGRLVNVLRVGLDPAD